MLKVTLGLIGAISAITIPTLAYNYRAKVLEEQFRSTYSDIKQIGTMINYQKGDVGEYDFLFKFKPNTINSNPQLSINLYIYYNVFFTFRLGGKCKNMLP